MPDCDEGRLGEDVRTGHVPSVIVLEHIGAAHYHNPERRLLYVAMTRAKDDLHRVVPQRFFVHGQHAQGDRRL
jgi:superfamily I DNA/RNA helicase